MSPNLGKAEKEQASFSHVLFPRAVQVICDVCDVFDVVDVLFVMRVMCLIRVMCYL